MQIMVDDSTRPMSWFMTAALGYLFGLGFVGLMFLLARIKMHGSRNGWPQWLISLLVGLHSLIGLITFTLVPASVLHRLKLQGATSTSGGVAFAAAIFAMISIGSFIMRDWNRTGVVAKR